jgi:hypothetical protein
MDAADFQKTRNALFTEQRLLEEQRTTLENELVEVRHKISHLQEVLNHLAPLTGNIYPSEEHDIPNLGLTDAVRAVLIQANTQRLSAADVRQKLKDCGYDLSGLSAPMQSIYKILSRITEGENSEFEREKEDFRSYYKWKGFEITDEDIPF